MIMNEHDHLVYLDGFVPMVLTGLTNVVIGHEWVIRSARSDPYEI